MRNTLPRMRLLLLMLLVVDIFLDCLLRLRLSKRAFSKRSLLHLLVVMNAFFSIVFYSCTVTITLILDSKGHQHAVCSFCHHFRKEGNSLQKDQGIEKEVATNWWIEGQGDRDFEWRPNHQTQEQVPSWKGFESCWKGIEADQMNELIVLNKLGLYGVFDLRALVDASNLLGKAVGTLRYDQSL